MINLKIRTEYSFRHSYGKIADIIALQGEYAAITDRETTFGHIPFWNECKKQGKKPILGVELAFVENAKLKVSQTPCYATLIAKNANGLRNIYKLVSLSTKQKYYYNRLSFEDLAMIGDDVIMIVENSVFQDYISGFNNIYYGVSPMTNYGDFCKNKYPIVAISDNIYPRAEDKELYEIIMGKGTEGSGDKKKFIKCEDRTEACHILSDAEWSYEAKFLSDEQKASAIAATYQIAESIDIFDFSKAELPKSKNDKSLLELCLIGKEKRRLTWSDQYQQRLERELQVIENKNFEDYFFLVADLVAYAKTIMLVGPARGSSAGSLACYLLEITEVDPIIHGLLFERFIDLNRSDLPDCDLDFQDDKRDMLLGYLKEKYGDNCVAKLGVISQYKPRSILTEIAKVLQLQQWDVKDLKDSIVENDAGDDRGLLENVFANTKVGQEFAIKYPNIEYSQFIEGHARHYGQHAAAIVVSDKPLDNYCTLDYAVDGCQLDKNDAEKVNLLKVDCLSLSTLTSIQNCLDMIGKDRDWLLSLPLDDQKVFDTINNGKYHGIFQFEGDALVQVSKQIEIRCFEDMSAITSLARPGTLINGETNRYIKNKNSGKITYQHNILEPILKETYGVIVYQEQVMQIVKQIGNFSWEDTSRIRKAIGKSMGGDYINKMKPLFIKGCSENNVDEESANAIWKNILDMGSYTFNKSHAVAYSMLSYWCMVLKTYYPLEFAVSILRKLGNEDSDKAIKLLRELVRDGYEYKPFDPELSDVSWSIKDGKLIGGFTNIKGIAEKKAQKYIDKRSSGKALTAVEKMKLFNAETPYDYLYEFKEKFKDFYDNWPIFLKEEPRLLKDIEEGDEVRFLAKTILVKLKDINDAYQLEKRQGVRIEEGCMKFLDLIFADDTDTIKCRIDRTKFEALGKKILDEDKEGDYYIISGKCCNGFKFIFINNIRKITALQVKNKVNENK